MERDASEDCKLFFSPLEYSGEVLERIEETREKLGNLLLKGREKLMTNVIVGDYETTREEKWNEKKFLEKMSIEKKKKKKKKKE